MSIPHPLLHTWTLWYYEKDNKISWENSLTRVMTVDTVEDFWKYILGIKTPSQLEVNKGYLFFKNTNKPIIEKYYINGGKWIFMINLYENIDKYWIEMLMCIIGTDLKEFDILEGIYVSKTLSKSLTQITIQIWVSNTHNHEEIKKIADELKKVSGFKNKIYFFPLKK